MPQKMLFFCGIGILCAIAYAIVAKAYPCTEYSGSGTETIRFLPTKDNWKLSYYLQDNRIK